MNTTQPAPPDSVMDASTLSAEHPWPGLQSYGEADARWFHGRENETTELLRLVRREALTVLFGQSGQGKTSLLQAGLFPRLRDEDLLPVYIRLDLDDEAADLVSQIGTAIARECARNQIEAPALAPGQSLWEAFHHRDCAFWSPRSRLLTPVLAFDQFEEIFTLGRLNPARRAACDALLAELGDLIENRCPAALRARIEASPELADAFDDSREAVKIIFSFREDYLADFDILHDYIRARSRNRLRLTPMDGDRACVALCTAAPALLDAPMAERLIRNVTADASATLVSIQVEPALLSLFCRELNDQRLAAGHATFTPELLQSDSTGQIIGEFYERAFAGLDARVRHFVEDRLLTRDGHRDSCALENALAEPGLSEAALQTLTDRRLLRREERGRRVRLELVHDVLATPARANRDQRQQAEALVVAQREASANRRKMRRVMALAAVMGVMVLGMLGLGGMMREKNRQMEQMTRVSLTRQLAVQANEILSDVKQAARPRRVGVLLALEAQGLSLDIAGRVSVVKARYQSETISGEPLLGSEGDVLTVAFSPDGKTLASAGIEGTIRLWDLITHQLQGVLQGNENSLIDSITFSPDGKTLAITGHDKEILLLDVITGKPLGAPLRGHVHWVNSVAFSPDGKTLASASADKTIRLWDVTTGHPLGAPLRGHMEWVNSVAFSPDGKTLASAGSDNTIRLWDVASRKSLGQPLKGHKSAVNSVAFSPDGKMLASASYDKTIRLWNSSTRQPLGHPLREHDNYVHSVAFSPDGKTLASGSQDHTLRLWDVATRQPLGQPLIGHKDTVWSVAFSPDGKMLASAGGSDCTVRLWNLITPPPLSQQLRGHTNGVTSAAFNPDGKTLATSGNDSTIRFWDVSTRKPLGEPLKGHEDGVYSVAFSPDGKTLATSGYDSTIRFWDGATRKPLGEPLKGHAYGVLSVAFSPDGKKLASASRDDTICLWDLTTRRPWCEALRGHVDCVYSVAFSPDGKTLASASGDRTIRLWDVTTRQLLGEPLLGHESSVLSVAFSPDGKTLASASGDSTVRLWNLATRHPLGKPLRGHVGWVDSVAFSPDGKTLASGSRNGTVRLWDVTTRQPLGDPLYENVDSVNSIAFSPNSKTLVGGSGHDIHFWDVDFAAWPAHLCKAAGHNLTHAEWAEFIGDFIPYHKTCPDLPGPPD